MGQLLSHPVDDKTIEEYAHDTLSYSVGAMQGYRMTMEDAHDVWINLHETLAVMGVFDGHGGSDCSHYLSQHLIRHIFKSLNTNKDGVPQVSDRLVKDTISIIRDEFFALDAKLSTDYKMINCGSTAVVAVLIRNRYIVVANTGDSRCILSVKGSVKTMSFDHKPSTVGEKVRIENANGYVINGRVNEVLALSRAFGDFKFKNSLIRHSDNVCLRRNQDLLGKALIELPPDLVQVTVEPEFLVYDLSHAACDTPEFMVLACDGIWDCYKADTLVKVIRDKLALEWSLHRITEYILNQCLLMANNYTGIGFDNMTLIIVAIHPDISMSEWRHLIRDKILCEKQLI